MTDKPTETSNVISSRRFRTILVLLAVILLGGGAIWLQWGRSSSELDRIFNVGVAAMRAEDLGTAQAAAEALADLDGAAPHYHLLEGYVLVRSGRLSDGIAEIQLAVDHPQTAALANMLAGETLYRNRQYRDAINAFRQALDEDGSLLDARRRLAAVLFDIGTTEEAVKHLEIIAEQAPDDPRPNRLMGLIYKDMESFEIAIRQYREALRRDPDLPDREEVLYELASCLLKTRQFSELDEVLAQAEPSADLLAIRAEALFQQGDAQEAAKSVTEALKLAPNHLEALLAKATIDLSQGDAEQAAKTLEDAAKIYPTEYRVHHKLAQAYARLQRTDDAKEQSAKAERWRNLRSRFADLHGKASVDVDNAEIRYQLGLMARELQREDLAISWFSAATAIDPNHAAAQAALRSSAATSPK